ncbi:hypothetical protein BASA81_004086 [Batrachochytrium salamandrivorans]|nr:hypothetical protein BASA81_004086 [Batrachochytrium salamandrivorans]
MTSSAASSRSLFWEEEVPGRTQLHAKILVSYVDSHKVTFYEIQVKVTSGEGGEEDTPELRIWKVKRRYSEFASLHRALGDLGFPCPSLPPRQLWGGHTSSFMSSRLNALNCWIQGVIIIWQSAAPNRGPSVAYAIGEMLEGFLCSEDSETFYRILEEVQGGGWEDSGVGRGGGEEGGMLSPHIPARRASPQVPTSSIEMHQSRQQRPSFAQVAQEKRRSKVRSVDDFSKLVPGVGGILGSGSLVTSASTTSLRPLQASSSIALAAAAASAASPSSSLAPVATMPSLPSNMIGFAVANAIEAAGVGGKQYDTYNALGEKVHQEFHPFVQRVEFSNNKQGFPDSLKDACTPVSVPPTPFGQNQFNAQWNHYTSSVLEFVQERLNIVQRGNGENFNILDRHSLRSAPHSQDEHEEEEHEQEQSTRAITNSMSIIDLKSTDRPKYVLGKDLLNPQPTASASLLGALGGGNVTAAMDPKLLLVASYVRAGEHLIHTILKEAEADIMDWQFVSNTKDVIVMRRLRPIKKRNLLQSRGGDDQVAGNNNSPPFETSQHCFMGRGLVDASAEAIFDLVRRPDKRHFYDSMLNEELVLENWAVGGKQDDALQGFEASNIGNLLVYYHLFETNRCFLRYVRDFCVVQYAKKVVVRGQPVKYVVVGASINHANCPLREGVERATLDLFGWVVEPTQKPNQSKVSYMMHIDFGKSGVPTHLLNTISFRQPLAVHYLRRHMCSLPSNGATTATAKTAAGATATAVATTATTASSKDE